MYLSFIIQIKKKLRRKCANDPTTDQTSECLTKRIWILCGGVLNKIFFLTFFYIFFFRKINFVCRCNLSVEHVVFLYSFIIIIIILIHLHRQHHHPSLKLSAPCINNIYIYTSVHFPLSRLNLLSQKLE